MDYNTPQYSVFDKDNDEVEQAIKNMYKSRYKTYKQSVLPSQKIHEDKKIQYPLLNKDQIIADLKEEIEDLKKEIEMLKAMNEE
jgi:predicted RNase H-like nuclease (RuvC/YqgF family)